MKIKIVKSNTIKTIEDWFTSAPPQGGNLQWKDGYSAKELAKFVIKKQTEFQNLIQDVINEAGIKNCNYLEGEPEASTRLPFSHRGSRKHDLLLRSDKFIIGVEAKAKEAFGNDKSGSKEKERRLKWMQEMLFSPQEKNGIKDIPYQLLTGITGTLLEAKRNHIYDCIFLILVFIRDKENQKNEEALNFFINKLGADKGIVINVKEPDEKEGTKIKCWVKKRVIKCIKSVDKKKELLKGSVSGDC